MLIMTIWDQQHIKLFMESRHLLFVFHDEFPKEKPCNEIFLSANKLKVELIALEESSGTNLEYRIPEVYRSSAPRLQGSAGRLLECLSEGPHVDLDYV